MGKVTRVARVVLLDITPRFGRPHVSFRPSVKHPRADHGACVQVLWASSARLGMCCFSPSTRGFLPRSARSYLEMFQVVAIGLVLAPSVTMHLVETLVGTPTTCSPAQVRATLGWLWHESVLVCPQHAVRALVATTPA